MKILLLPFLAICSLASAQSPITFAITDAPVAGPNSKQRIAVDTLPLPAVNFGNPGANQVYDFSNLVMWKYDTVEYRVPTSGQLSTCPDADDALTTDGISFLFTNTDNANNKLTLEGFQGELTPGNTISAAYSVGQKPDLFHFPTTYQSTFNGTAYLQKTVPGSQVGQSGVNAVRLTINTTYSDNIDGWGKVITPVGAYKCLRKKRDETTTTLIEYQLFSGFPFNTLSTSTKTTTRYTYVTKEAMGSVINFNYDTAGVLQSVNWSMTPPAAPTADFTWTNGSAGLVNFTDQSDGYPTSWSWTFGDGGTSTTQNPNHTYSANGNYTVCLTASNAGGSSVQVCKQVTVSNVPVTPVADFTFNNVAGGLVNFTDQSTNTPTSWAWTFGDGATSTLQSPVHTYSANNTYNVCLTATNAAGSNQVCKNVAVTGLGGGNNAPLAVNDAYTVTSGSDTIVHVADNDADPNNDLICVTAVWGSPYATEAIGGSCDMIEYQPDSTFSGMDTCYYQLCDNGNPVLCDTGMVVWTVNPLNHPPVAADDTASVTQPNSGIFNVGLNDTDPDGNNSFCVTAVYGSPAFSVASVGNCTSVQYQPDSTFTGNDTCWYVICDNGSPVLCDTGTLVVTSVANPALLPNVTLNLQQDFCYVVVCAPVVSSADSLVYFFHTLNNTIPDTTFYNVDTAYYYTYQSDAQSIVEVCVTAYNSFGMTTACDTTLAVCEGINQIALNGINLYPNPANKVLTIDMKNNQDDITNSYASIEVYNQLGQQVKSLARKNETKVVSIPVADLPEGMYVVAITGAKGERRTLGRFTIYH